MLHQHVFRAMNTRIVVMVVADPMQRMAVSRDFLAVEAAFKQVETCASRFSPESELSRLNERAGQTVTLSPLLAQLIGVALHWARETDGVYDPTILPALERAGYDRSFEQIEGQALAEGPAPEPPAHDWRDARFSAPASECRLPAGMRLDLGGVGKGWTVDRSLALLRAWPAAAVNAGGDLAVFGAPPGLAVWTTGIEDPSAPERRIVTVGLRDRALATSGIRRRQWRRGDQRQHHLIDPRTGRPAWTGLLACTVIAPNATEADVLAKCAFILGPDQGLPWLAERQRAALMVTEQGERLATPLFEGYVVGDETREER